VLQHDSCALECGSFQRIQIVAICLSGGAAQCVDGSLDVLSADHFFHTAESASILM
jgi:hypothetical protein